MDEYIKREEAMHIAFKSPFFSDALMEEMKAIPAADVAPVRKGRWESVGLSSLKCSDCGYLDDMKMYHRYCPDCGCFMR